MSELKQSDYTPEQVEAWARQIAAEFIERMDETYVFLSDQITGYEIALRLIQEEIDRLKKHSNPHRGSTLDSFLKELEEGGE